MVSMGEVWKSRQAACQSLCVQLGHQRGEKCTSQEELLSPIFMLAGEASPSFLAVFYSNSVPVLSSLFPLKSGCFHLNLCPWHSPIQYCPALLNNLEAALCLNIHRAPWAGAGTTLTTPTHSDSSFALINELS